MTDHPYDSDLPYVVEADLRAVARFRDLETAGEFVDERVYSSAYSVIDTTPKGERPMTSQTNASLIAEARGAIDRSFHNSCQGRHADLLHRLAAALEAAEQRAGDAERELQVAEDQANNLAGDLAQAEKRAEEAERLAEVRRETIREYERENESWSVRAHTAERERDRLDEAFDRDLPWRYDEVETQRNQLAAVVEKVRAARANHPACEKHPDGDPISCGWKGAVLDIDAALATAPDDALREVKAAAWDEGHDVGWEDRHQDALAGWMPSDSYESEAVNPYRKEQS